MSKFFTKLPGFIQAPSGFEWALFKKLPLLFLLGTLFAAIPMLHIYFFDQPIDLDKQKTIYMSLGLIFSYWFMIGTVAIGCVVVMIMKGPAYVADPYDLPKENPELENKQNKPLFWFEYLFSTWPTTDLQNHGLHLGDWPHLHARQ